MKRRTFIILGALLILGVGPYAIHSWWHEHYYHLTASGALGCGRGNVTVHTTTGPQQVQTGLDTPRLLGREIEVRKLEKILEKRIARLQSGKVEYNKKTNRSEYELMLAAHLLAEIKHPRALDYFTALLEDPKFRSRSAEWLTQLENPEAGERLLKSWDIYEGAHPWLYVKAFQRLSYEPAIPYLIDSFYVRIDSYSVNTILESIENCSGEELPQFRTTGRLRTEKDVSEYKEKLFGWYNEYTANKSGQPTAQTLRVSP
jgi:hypothetical protein